MEYLWSMYGVSSKEEQKNSGVSLKGNPLFTKIT